LTCPRKGLFFIIYSILVILDCDETFAHERTLQAHLKAKHGPNKTECKCTYTYTDTNTKCSMSSIYPKDVKSHMMNKHGCSEEEANAATGITSRRKSGSAEEINEADEPKKKKKAIL
jgi:hypothetical protein